MCSKLYIILNVPSIKIVSLQLPGGRTTHSKFKILVRCLESSIFNFGKKYDIYKHLQLTKLLIWDATPMTNKFCFEALNKSLKDIMTGDKVVCKNIFEEKVIIFVNDFR